MTRRERCQPERRHMEQFFRRGPFSARRSHPRRSSAISHRGWRVRLGAVSHVRATPWAVWVEFPLALIVSPARVFLTHMIPSRVHLSCSGRHRGQHLQRAGDTPPVRTEPRSRIHHNRRLFEEGRWTSTGRDWPARPHVQRHGSPGAGSAAAAGSTCCAAHGPAGGSQRGIGGIQLLGVA